MTETAWPANKAAAPRREKQKATAPRWAEVSLRRWLSYYRAEFGECPDGQSTKVEAWRDKGERDVHFQISGLEREWFRHLFALSEQELATHGVLCQLVTGQPGYPCRVSLKDLEPGETVLLLNYTHLDATTPYRASHAIFVGENSAPADLDTDEVPESVRNRLMSARGFGADGMMLDADVVEGARLEPLLRRLLGNAAVEFVHLHNAKRGCYAARVDRA